MLRLVRFGAWRLLYESSARASGLIRVGFRQGVCARLPGLIYSSSRSLSIRHSSGGRTWRCFRHLGYRGGRHRGSIVGTIRGRRARQNTFYADRGRASRRTWRSHGRGVSKHCSHCRELRVGIQAPDQTWRRCAVSFAWLSVYVTACVHQHTGACASALPTHDHRPHRCCQRHRAREASSRGPIQYVVQM